MPKARSRPLNAIQLLMEDHDYVKKAFRAFEKMDHEDHGAMKALVSQVCEALKVRLAPEVVLMTGMPNPTHARRAADLGVVALLLKPFTREAVLGALATALERCKRDPLAGLRTHFGAHPRAR